MVLREQLKAVLFEAERNTADIEKVVTNMNIWDYAVDVPLSHILVSHLAHKADLCNKQVPFTVSCDAGANWFREKRQFKVGQAYGGNYVPQIGDIVYFSSTYSQADATSVGYVTNFDGTIVTTLGMDGDVVGINMYYMDNPYIIGYGIPIFNLDIVSGRRLFEHIAIARDDIEVHTIANDGTPLYGTLPKHYSVPVIEIMDNGWLKIEWRTSPNKIGYIKPNCFLMRQVDSYQPYNGPRVGDTMWCDATRYYMYPSDTKGRPKVCKPALVKVEEVRPNGMIKVSNKLFNGWVRKSFVDFPTDVGYNKTKGEVDTKVLNFRIGPSATFTKVQQWPQLVCGNKVTIVGKVQNDDGTYWYHIWFEGYAGYVYGKHIKEV